jgi:predicted acylesterase/phospholipase RssA
LRANRHPIGLALAGGGPFGAIYEIGALIALEESLDGLDLNGLDCYVGVSAGSFLAAALANGVPVAEIYRLFIAGEKGEDAVTPRLFTRPAYREFLRAALGRRIPAGFLDNDSIHEYLAETFTRPGRTNDFRELGRSLYLVATDLDSGESVSFGRPGYDRVPISKAVEASAALPGLFPPVEVGGRYYVDGALKKTLHASEALDDGAKLVLCVNPIVPYDASLAAEKGRARHSRLIEGGLPVILSQAFRAIIHSRMAAGIAKYRTQYRGSDVVLFEPEADDTEIFFTNIFSYASRRRVCEHAYERTRLDLARRRAELEPIFSRHGIRMRQEVLDEAPAGLELRRKPLSSARELRATAGELRDALVDLRRCLAARPSRPS